MKEQKQKQTLQTPHCPATIELVNFVTHQLDDKRRTKIQSHFVECAGCRELITSLYCNDKISNRFRRVG